MTRPWTILMAAPMLLLLNAAGCQSEGEGQCAFDGESGSLSSCGNIEVSASAQCTAEIEPIACKASCTPISFIGECSGRCDVSASASCTGSCDIAGCEASCEANPGMFSCQGECQTDCNLDCSAQCEASGNMGNCEAECDAGCTGKCEGSCEGTPPSASCNARCEASCSGQCEASANFDCNIDCHAELTGGCDVACDSPNGALYCDGDFVDTGGNFGDCVASLNACLSVEVEASGSADCADNKCQAQAEGSITCAMPATPLPKDTPWHALALCALGVGLISRRRS